MNNGELVQWVPIVLTLLGMLGGLLVMAFKIGGFAAVLSENTKVTAMLHKSMVAHDERMDEFDLALKDKVDKEDFDILKHEFIVLQTQHTEHHKIGGQ